MIDIFLLFIYSFIFWFGLFWLSKGVSRLLSFEGSYKELKVPGHYRDRLFVRNGTPYFLVVLGLYNFLMSKTELFSTNELGWEGIAFIFFNVLLLSSYILIVRILRNGDS